ncbi:MAG: dockerin type I repeat-containing protein [Bacteroidales bacterium]|nr:dockerin type I repeat-containing protein [Bacteroidales bacterium]
MGASAIKVADEVQVFGYLSLGNFSGSIIHYNEEYPLVPKYNPTGWRTTLSVPEGSIPRYMYSGWCRTEGPLFKAITDGISTFQLINEGDTWFAPHVDMLSAKAGDEVELSVVLDADQSVTGFQFDLYLPDGIEVTTDDDGYEDIYLSTKRTTERRHTFTSQQQPDGSWRVLCYSNSNYSFNGNEGEVCIINVKIGDNLAENSYPIIFKNVVTSYLNGEGNTEQSQRDQLKTYINLWPEPEPYVNKMGSGDATNDGVVNVTDITAIVSYILGNNPTGFDFWQADAYQDEAINVTDIAATVNIIMNDSSPQQAPRRMARRNVRKFADKSTTASLEVIPFAITPGEEKEVEVILNNPDNAFTGLQFDLTLPEGINLASDEDGYLVNLGSRTTSRKHTIEAQQRADGAIRVMAYSNRNSNFSGSEGDVVILTLKADNDLAGGIYNLQMKDIVLSQANGDEINQIVPANYEGSILSGTLAENPIIKGDITVEAAALIASAVSEAVTSIDLTNAVAVAKDAVFTTANPNTLIRVAEEIQVNTQNVISGQTCANLVLTDKNAYAATCAFTALQASFNANVNSYKTLTLPFDAPVPEGISASNATSVTGTRVNLKSTSTISANDPVLIQGDGSIEISATNVAVVATDGTALTNGVLCGTYKNILAPIGCYVLQKQNGVMRFCHVEDGQPVVGAFRAYLNVPESNVQIYTFDEDDATSIASLPEDTEESVTVYNIAGQHISKVQKGINIINGKKILK